MEIAKALALVLIVTTMAGAGLQLDRRHLAETLRDAGLLARALLANFILVPLFAFGLVRWFGLDTGVAVGILLMAMAPGVPFLANSAGRKQGGSLAFALEASLLFSALSVVTLPLTATLLIPPEAIAQVPAVKILVQLVVFQFVPLTLGVLLSNRLAEPVIVKAVKALRITFLVAAVAIAVLLFPKIIASVGTVYGSGNLLIIAAIGIFSLAVGWLFGGPDRRYRRTLSIASLLRNIGMAVVIGTNAPESLLIVPTVIAYFVVTFSIGIVVRIYYQRSAGAPAPVA